MPFVHQSDNRSRRCRQRDEVRRIAASYDGLAVWLRVKLPDRPRNISRVLGELAEPDFNLENCRESLEPAGGGCGDYGARWYCRFLPGARDAFSTDRLLERLRTAGFEVMRYDPAPND